MGEPIVLLVEDNEDDVLFARLALERAGHPHSLVVARDGEEALAVLRAEDRQEQTPTVVLLDLKLPKVDGKTVLKEIRGSPRTSRVPVVVMTSSRLEEDLLDAYTLGANSYYQKPMDFDAFSKGVRVLLTYWFQYNVGTAGSVAGGADAQRLDPSLLSVIPAPGSQIDRRSAGPEVAIIDGNAAERAATLDGLQCMAPGVRVEEVPSYEAATALLQRIGGPPPYLAPGFPRLILLDLDLPGGDGRDILHAIRYRADHHVVVVVFTRALSQALVNECYRLKVNALLCKPESPDAYREAVCVVARYWLGMNARPPSPGIETAKTPRPG